ncbi:MAG: hypothetical protein LBR56_03295, partial [Sporomusaceae bacterium]|jgi:hypothetical protein|nr:hypothetical protein [Sporomusaceae bacterium]
LQKIDASVLKAIIKLAEDIEGDLNDPQDISAIAPSIKEAILKLSATMEKPESAYEIWLALGNTGTKEDFLNSLKGEKGADGKAQGPAGASATIEIGEVTTGEAGTAAAVENVGTGTAAKFNFIIPRGEKGVIGDVNLPGLLDNEIITCNIEDLQTTLDSLPKFLNKDITIKTNPGVFAQDIYLQDFFGYGSLYLLGADTIAETHQLRSINIFNCRTYIVVAGFDLLADGANTPASVHVWNNSPVVELSNLNITKGVKTNSANYGIGSTHSYTKISSCNISNKSVAIDTQRGIVIVGDIRGTGNNTCFLSSYAGILQKYGACTISGSVLNQNSPGSILVN